MYNEWKRGGKRKTCKSFDLFDEDGFDACRFDVIEILDPDATREEILIREKYWFQNTENVINSNSPYRTDEEKKAYHKAWRDANRDRIREQGKLRQRQYRAMKKSHTISDYPIQSTADTEPLPVDSTDHS